MLLGCMYVYNDKEKKILTSKTITNENVVKQDSRKYQNKPYTNNLKL